MRVFGWPLVALATGMAAQLDTFTRIQPAHFRIDADYRERKQVASGATVWAIGQVTAARRLFGFSILYLFALFAILLLEVVVAAAMPMLFG